MNRKKQIAIFCLIQLIGWQVATFAQTVVNHNGIRYLIENGQAVIGRQDKELSGNIVIPNSIIYGGNEYSVTRIIEPTNITAWTSNTVTCEGGAFQDCQIESITLPNTITKIAAGTFNGCQKLLSVKLPQNTTEIGAAAFARCQSIKNIDIPASVTTFGSNSRYGFISYTFGGTTSLKNINIPEGVKILAEGCFLNSGIDSLYIPASITSLYDNSLAVIKLKYLKMAIKNIEAIKFTKNVFTDISNTDLYVPKGSIELYQEQEPWSEFKSIREYGADTDEVYKPSQINVTIDGLKYILKGQKAIVGRQNPSLSGDITIPGSVKFEDIEYPVTEIVSPKDLTCYSGESISCVGGAFQNSSISSIQIPASISKLPAGVFQNCHQLKNVVLPNGLTQIGAACFAGCVSLEQINIPSSVTDLASSTNYGYRSYTFGGCSKLKTVTIPACVTRLATGCFMNSGIEKITIHDKLLTLDEKCLYTSSLKEITICVKDMEKLTYTNSVFADISKTDLFVPKGSKQVYQEYYPWIEFKSITEYDDGSKAFVPSKVTTRINGVRYILDNNIATIARQNKDLDGDIIIPESVEYNGNVYTVKNMVEPTNITAWSHTITCENGAFQDCRIRTIELPNTINTIAAGAFNGCKQLVYAKLPNNVKQLGAASFADCSNLKEIYLPETITELGSYTRYGFKSYVFGNCTNLRKVNIPLQVSKIAEGCFKGAGLETFLISSSIQTIEEDCFSGRHLKYFKITHKELTNLKYTESCFADVNNIELLVPKDCKKLYEQFYPWKNFKSISEYNDEEDKIQYNAYKVSYEIIEDNQPTKSRSLDTDMEAINTVVLDYWPSGISWDKVVLPTLDGYNVQEWEGIPKNMPSHDIIIKAHVYQTTGISNVVENIDEPTNVYSVNGVKICKIKTFEEIKEKLQTGIYIINGKKIVVK